MKIIKRTLFFSVLCFGLIAPATWGHIPSVINLKNVTDSGISSNLSRLRNITTSTALAQRDKNFEDGRIGGQSNWYHPNEWPMYNYNHRGTRYNKAEHQLNPENVHSLKLKWSFTTEGNVNATPIIVDHKVYAGDTSGNFYALSQTGQLLWKTKVNGSITASALATHEMIIVGDQKGFVYGLNRQTGKIVWSIRPNPHPFAQVYSSPTLVGRYVAIGIASDEDAIAAHEPTYHCCSFRGSVVLLNPSNGAIVWQTYTISPEEAQKGASGASIWSTPTYDATTNLVYVTTGDNYTEPATTTSDAFIAVKAQTGTIVWQHQLVANDAGGNSPDVDFGDSPQIYRLPDGMKVVSAGEKSGIYYVLNAATGALVNQYKALPQCQTALGFFADSAVANGIVYANGTDCSSLTGELFALKGNGAGEIWHFISPGSPALSGVAVANGVVYFQVVSASGGFLYALDAKNGMKLTEIPISPAISGPSVADGQVYLGTGITYPPFVTTQGGSILSFGL